MCLQQEVGIKKKEEGDAKGELSQGKSSSAQKMRIEDKLREVRK